MAPEVRLRWAELLSAAGQMSVDELMALPEHRGRYELIAGHLTQRLPDDLRYDMILRLLVSSLREHVRVAHIEATIVQEAGVVVSAAGEPDTMFVPALAVILSSRVPVSDASNEIPSIRIVPEFVVEIAAPGQSRQVLDERARTWLGAGTRVVWVIWPANRQVHVWRSGGDVPASGDANVPDVTICNIHNVLELPDLLPGFSYPVVNLFN